jgi:hypothetical protein
VLEVRQQRRPLPGERPPAPEQVPGGPPAGGRDLGLRQQAPAEQPRTLVGVDRGVVGRAAMDGLPRESVPEDNRAPCLSPHVSAPVPGAEAFASPDYPVSVGRDGREKRLGTRLHVPVQHALALLVQETDVHAAGVEVDPAVKGGLGGVDSPEVSSSLASNVSHSQQTTVFGLQRSPE